MLSAPTILTFNGCLRVKMPKRVFRHLPRKESLFGSVDSKIIRFRYLSMPVCNRCEKTFDVETAPGALMFGHPSTVTEAVPVWKAHICQECETEMVAEFKRKPLMKDPKKT